jgi:hypothetical protein
MAGTPVYAILPSVLGKLLRSLGRLAVRGVSRLAALVSRSG